MDSEENKKSIWQSMIDRAKQAVKDAETLYKEQREVMPDGTSKRDFVVQFLTAAHMASPLNIGFIPDKWERQGVEKLWEFLVDRIVDQFNKSGEFDRLAA